MPQATVHRLVPKQERITRDGAQEALGVIMALPESVLPPHLLAQLRHVLYRAVRPAPSEGVWPGGFTMISIQQTEVIWDAIRVLSRRDRPSQVRHAFDLVLLNLRHDTGEVMLTRDQFAAKMCCEPREVSKAMSVLARLGVIERQTRRVEGMRGPGVVAYFINPHCAWNGSLENRRDLATVAVPPLLTIMNGGKAVLEEA